MAGYFGTDTQQRLQAQAEANADFIFATPGACQGGRVSGCDDADRLGWPKIYAILQRDRACGFRLLPAGKLDGVRIRLLDRGYRLDTWQVFVADRLTAIAASRAVLARPLPDGVTFLDTPVDPEHDRMRQIQAMMTGAGIAPFSGSMLTGRVSPATTVCFGDKQGDVIATAHGYMPHNAYSLYHDYAWAGLVAVAESHRGLGLGRHINARVVASAFRNLRATHVYELIAPANAASRRMVEACGLRHDPTLVCGMATPLEQPRFTL